MGNLAISALAQDPSNFQNIYAGTGEGWYNLDAIQGLGIWKSTDGGATWAQLASTNISTFGFVQKIVVTNTGVVLAATRSGGIQRSTDGGATWTKVLGSGTGGGITNRAADLEIAANGNIYASAGIFSVDGIYRSSDAGATWTKIYSSGADEYRIEIACAPSNLDKVYALIMDADGPNQYGIKKVISTSNATAGSPTWTTLTNPNWCDQGSVSNDFTRGQAWYDLIAVVDPADENTLFAGGVDIMKTTNGGTSWSQSSRWSSFGGCSGTTIHADIHSIIYKPGSSSEILVGNDGGIFRSTDGGGSYTSRVTGYNVTQYYACAIHPSSTNYFLAGAQDNGTQKFTAAGVNTATTVTGGDGAFCHIDQTNGNLQITSYVYNNYYVSTNGGTSFTQRFFGNTGSFINPTDYDDNADILYGGNDPGTFFRWNDAGTGGTNTDNVTVTNFAGAEVMHVTASPITANRVYFGLDNGSLVRVDNAHTGTTIAGIIIKTGVGSVSSIAIDPVDENHMLVTYSNYGVTSIFESFNATQASPAWTSVEGNLPDMPVRWAMFDPRNSDWALLATELGVWSTADLDGGATDWDPTNTGLANVRVDMLQYRSSDRTIAAATHGRGLFTAVVPINSTPEISFASSSATAAEATGTSNGCRSYTDYTVDMVITNAPAGDATVTLNIQGGNTATRYVDFDFTTNGNFTSPSNTIVFTDGVTSSKTINLRIYDDAEVETSQEFILTYSISGSTNAQAGSSSQTYTFTITDNDTSPSGPFSQNIWTENFEATLTGWNTQQAGSGNRNNWQIGSGCGVDITASTAQVVRIQGASSFCGYGTNTGTIYIYKQVDATLYTNVQVQFNWRAGGDGTTDYGQLVYSTNGGSTWQTVGGTYANQSTTQAASVSLPSALNNSTFLLGWSFTSDNSGGNQSNSFGIDDIVVSGTRPGTSVESAANSSRSTYLGPNSDVYFYSSTDGELLARIRNLSSHDYGCTNIEIDRAGTGSSQFWNTVSSNYLVNKSFRVIPATNNPSGQYEITLYYSQAEIQGWETATGQTWGGIQLIKLPSQISNVTPANPEPDGAGTVQVVTPTLGTLGSNYSVTYTFNNGFSGFGAGIPGAAGTLPVELLSFTGKLNEENSQLDWTTVFEQNNRGFEIEKSMDGVNYHKIGFVNSDGNSTTRRSYSFTDPQKAVEHNYYRLKIIDIDNTYDYSDVILVKNTGIRQDVVLIGNPFADKIRLRFSRIPGDDVAVTMYDIKGSKVYEKVFKGLNQQVLELNTDNKFLANGIYSVKVETGGKVYNLKATKQ
jgi:hypothetical protein